MNLPPWQPWPEQLWPLVTVTGALLTSLPPVTLLAALWAASASCLVGFGAAGAVCCFALCDDLPLELLLPPPWDFFLLCLALPPELEV